MVCGEGGQGAGDHCLEIALLEALFSSLIFQPFGRLTVQLKNKFTEQTNISRAE